MMGNSLFVVVITMFMIGIGSFVLYFFPVVMSGWLKIYLIVIVPTFTIAGYFIKTDIFLRKRLISGRKEIATFLQNTDALTGLGSMNKFIERYQQFLDTMTIRPKLDRSLAVSMFYVDNLDQYRYQNSFVYQKNSFFMLMKEHSLSYRHFLTINVLQKQRV